MLITGESGTGKELVARTVHALSTRRQGPFIAINCAALPESLIESELFGHEKGSFTGASRAAGRLFRSGAARHLAARRNRRNAHADAGQIAAHPGGFAACARLGGKHEFEVDVRVVAATNKVPEEAVRGGHLREDLYYRLNVFHVHIPPLRERKADIPALARGAAGGSEPQTRMPRGRDLAVRAGSLRTAQLAGQCARTSQRDGAGGHPGG